MDAFSLVISFLVIASTLQPLLQARYQAMQRARQIAAIEKERGSRYHDDSPPGNEAVRRALTRTSAIY
jgi:hypothetical protein